ncbi:MAG TPA: DUF3089 domain-containing protein [Byssovorax sp.]|jgi:hypothetical protein
MRTSAVFLAALAVLAPVLGCSPAAPSHVPALTAANAGAYRSARYADPAAWLCRPDLPTDACRGDLSKTEVEADGTLTIERAAPAPTPPIDCFYVYPTVDMGVFARNHTDFADRGPMERVAKAQIAQFSRVCRVFAPLYRQVTIGTYLSSPARRDEFLSVAFSDVDDAFLHYMATMNGGRRVALIGHSQGAEMVSRLLKKHFDDDPAMRAKLVVAMPIGGSVQVARGERTGGTFQHLPLCASADETGCVVAYRTHAAGRIADTIEPIPADLEAACVNPMDEATNRRRFFASATIPKTAADAARVRGGEGARTPFLGFPAYYTGRCVDGLHGYRYLEVSEAPRPGDTREPPFDLGSWMFGPVLGLHILDLQLPEAELVEMVRRKGAAGHVAASAPVTAPPP